MSGSAGSAATAVTWLFVPGNRPERFDRATSSGAGAVILDLEDAVAPPHKETARDAVTTWLAAARRAWVRINSLDTVLAQPDLAALTSRPGLAGVIAPKTETAEDLQEVRRMLPTGVALVGLVETARGIQAAASIAAVADRLAFGSVDFAADIGVDPSTPAEASDPLLLARSMLVLASRAHRRPPPIDGVTLAVNDTTAAAIDARRSRALGFGGKLCIHPRQVPVVEQAFAPTTAETAWADRILRASQGSAGVDVVDGEMVDLPVLARARRIMAYNQHGGSR